jgi:predicted Zn-dependent peptidase
VGDLPNDIEGLVRRYFAGLAGGAAPVRPAVPASPLTTAALMREAAEAAIVKIGWPSPMHRTRGDAAADLAAVLLEHNLGGRLWAEDGAIAALEAQQVSKAGSSLFVVQAVGRPGTPAREVLRAVEAALANLAGVSAEEVAAARAVMRVEAMGRRGSTMALAETIAAHMTAYGKADALADELQRYHSTGVEDVVALARDTLMTSRRAVLLADAEGGRA